jgi:hypothetical protein
MWAHSVDNLSKKVLFMLKEVVWDVVLFGPVCGYQL